MNFKYSGVIHMQNPFIFGPVVRGDNFCGRQKEIGELRSTVNSGMHVVLYSRRRTGKTSLIKRFFEEMERDRNCVYLDLSRITTQQEFFTEYAEQVLKASRSPSSSIKKIMAKVGKILGSIEMQVSAGPDGTVSVGLNPASLTKERIPDILSLSEHLGGKFIIALDEYQNVVNLPGDYDMEPFMRSVIQNFEKTSVIFAGSYAHMMRDIFSNPERPHYRLARGMSLGPLDREEALSFMDRKFSASDHKTGTDILADIYSSVNGDPYYLQALCFHFWSLVTDKADADINRAVENMINTEAMYFEAIWRNLSPGQKKVLKVIARGRNPYREKDTAKSSTAQALKVLQEKDLVEIPQRGTYVLTDPFLGKWITSSIE